MTKNTINNHPQATDDAWYAKFLRSGYDYTAMEKAYEEYAKKNPKKNLELLASDLEYSINRERYFEIRMLRKLFEVLDENNRLLTKKKYRKHFKKLNTGRGIKRFDLVKVGYSGVVGRVIDVDYIEYTAQVCFWARTFTFDLGFLDKANQYEIVDAEGTNQLG